MSGTGPCDLKNNWVIPRVPAWATVITLAGILCSGVWYVAHKDATDVDAAKAAAEFRVSTNTQLTDLNDKVRRLVYFYCTSGGQQKCTPDGVPK